MEYKEKKAIMDYSNHASTGDLVSDTHSPTMEEKEKPAETSNKGIWLLVANPKLWTYSGIKIGGIQTYDLYNSDTGKPRKILANLQAAKKGDLVVGYESSPTRKIMALGIISKDTDEKCLYFKKTVQLTNPILHDTFTKNSGLEKMEAAEDNFQGSLFKITKGEYAILVKLIKAQNPDIMDPNMLIASEAMEEPQKELPKESNEPLANSSYTIKDFLSEVYISKKRYETLRSLLLRKQNVILQGAPGVGKTFIAKRLAYSIIKARDDTRICFIQFHQNYSYEDFMMGYRPTETSFKMYYGIFYEFCRKATADSDNAYFFIIDEINRGNLSKIFGELLMLIESDKRGQKIVLAYNGEMFSVPKNLYIIGMMNTADRSLAMIDYALRRRFCFFDIEPAFDSDGFRAYQTSLESSHLNKLIEIIKALNEVIASDASLGEGFRIGHSYFCDQKKANDAWLSEVIEYELIPTLKEYWFDDKTKLDYWSDKLHGAINDKG
jgi:GTPase subunit of restriction endonuclease